LAFDANEEAVELARENADANGLTGKTTVARARAETILEQLDEPFDLVLLDVPHPPLLKLLRLSVRHTRHGGRLMVMAYPHALSEGSLDDAVARAREEEGRMAFQLTRPGLPPDFPTVLGAPDSESMSALALELN
jgi:23S rRNA (cytosine1962-C5)-methyltransferase